ncbi:MAG: DUF1254 domain-containing protein [Planctomycetales bacterium]
MKSVTTWVPALILTLVLLMGTPASAQLSDEEATDIGVEAYIYGCHPLVTMEFTRRVMTNVAAPRELMLPWAVPPHATHPPDAAFKDVTAPNADTLYSTAWLDLANEPYVLSLPDEHDRYPPPHAHAQRLDQRLPRSPANAPPVPKHRPTPSPAQAGRASSPPESSNSNPPTNMVWILGRTYCTGTPEDYTAVHAIMDQYQLTPLSATASLHPSRRPGRNPPLTPKHPSATRCTRRRHHHLLHAPRRSHEAESPRPGGRHHP